ncbi:MAG TPA: MFS transporter, partial [Planctomicrobium sp.]|nr:MFS transporter [Planctomicrobium sp.]
AGEAGAFPNTARIIARWFPAGERGRVQGFVLASAMIGGTVAPVLAGYMIHYAGWRLPFILFGTLGIIWAIVFAMWFRDDPAKHRAVNDGERRLLEENSHATTHHEPIPWRAVLRNRNVWLLGTITTCAAFTFYLYYSWYPKYLHAARDVGMIEAGWLTSLVLGGGMFGTVAGGLIADRFIQRSQSPMRWRRYFCFICFALAGLFLLFSFLVDSSHLSAGLVFVSCLTMSCQQSSWWSSVSELSGRHIGVLFGLMNSLGIPGAMASQYYFGASADWREAAGFTGRAQWDPAFLAYLCLLWTAAVCWLFVDSTSPITAKNAPPSVNAEEKCQLCST